MTPTSILGPIAFSVSLVALGAALVKHRGVWYTSDALIPGVLVLVTLHSVVPISDEVRTGLAILALMISLAGLWQLLQRSRARSTD